MRSSRNHIAIPPGATIREQIDDRGMTQKELAERMDMSEKHISKLINGDVSLTNDTAFRLEMVLGIRSSFWTQMESIYRENLALVEAENTMDKDDEEAKQGRRRGKEAGNPAAGIAETAGRRGKMRAEKEKACEAQTQSQTPLAEEGSLCSPRIASDFIIHCL